MPPQPTLHIHQRAAGQGTHAIRLLLRRPGQPDLEGEATIEFSLEEWYDYQLAQHDSMRRRPLRDFRASAAGASRPFACSSSKPHTFTPPTLGILPICGKILV